jgi:hypothetical protein
VPNRLQSTCVPYEDKVANHTILKFGTLNFRKSHTIHNPQSDPGKSKTKKGKSAEGKHDVEIMLTISRRKEAILAE